MIGDKLTKTVKVNVAIECSLKDDPDESQR